MGNSRFLTNWNNLTATSSPVTGAEDFQLVYFYYELRHKVERLRKTVHRLFDEMEGKQKKPVALALETIRDRTSTREKYILSDIVGVHLKDPIRPSRTEETEEAAATEAETVTE